MTTTSVAVIGGADGPTAIFLRGGVPMSLIIVGAAVLLAVIAAVAVFVARK